MAETTEKGTDGLAALAKGKNSVEKAFVLAHKPDNADMFFLVLFAFKVEAFC